MLRFIKHNLTSIDNIEFYPILSLLIFVLFFTGVIYYVMTLKKSKINELGSIPFEFDNSIIDKEEK